LNIKTYQNNQLLLSLLHSILGSEKWFIISFLQTWPQEAVRQDVSSASTALETGQCLVHLMSTPDETKAWLIGGGDPNQ
jgi:hypothetical protein